MTEPTHCESNPLRPSERIRARGSIAVTFLRGLVGAAIGGMLGWFGFHWLVGQGLLAPMLPGALLGLGCGVASGGRSQALGVLCAAGGTIIGLLAYWRVLLLEDDSLWFFVTHLHERSPVSLLMFGLGGLFAYWFGLGRER